MRRVICVGSVSRDIFFPTKEGVLLQTPEDVTSQMKVAFELGGKFRAHDRYESIGGVAANVAVGLARLGTEVSCYSRVGGDELGRSVRQTLEQEGVVTDALEIDRAVKTDLSAIIVIEQTGDRIIFHNRDANEHLVIDPRKLDRADWLYVSALNGRWRDNLLALGRSAQEKHQRIALNPGQHNLKDDPRLMLDFLRSVDVLFLNKDEAIELLLANKIETRPERLNDERFLLESLQKYGPTTVALTDGRRGAWASNDREWWHADSFEPHGLVDTTGGGDAFGSGFFSAYLKGYPIEVCLQYGICNAGNVVGFFGATPGLLDEAAMASLVGQVRRQRLAE